jgi:hypothetical protein
MRLHFTGWNKTGQVQPLRIDTPGVYAVSDRGEKYKFLETSLNGWFNPTRLANGEKLSFWIDFQSLQPEDRNCTVTLGTSDGYPIFTLHFNQVPGKREIDGTLSAKVPVTITAAQKLASNVKASVSVDGQHVKDWQAGDDSVTFSAETGRRLIRVIVQLPVPGMRPLILDNPFNVDVTMMGNNELRLPQR